MTALTFSVPEEKTLPALNVVTAACSTDAIKASGTTVSQKNTSSKFLAEWTSGLKSYCLGAVTKQTPKKRHLLVLTDKVIVIYIFSQWSGPFPLSFPEWGAGACVGAFGNWYWFELRSRDYYSHYARTHRSSTWCVSRTERETYAARKTLSFVNISTTYVRVAHSRLYLFGNRETKGAESPFTWTGVSVLSSVEVHDKRKAL